MRISLRSATPILRDVKEYWPGPPHVATWNKVRLPGGRYVSPKRSAWCRLYDANGQELARDGLSSAHVLLTHLTPVGIVPSLPSDVVFDEAIAAPSSDLHDHRSERPDPLLAQSDTMVNVSSSIDPLQQAKYAQANRFLWFHYTPAQVAAWYNVAHSTDDLIHFDHTGMANAGDIGRPEHTPSVARTRDKQHWTDFGAGGLHLDGRLDGGDVLELLVRRSGGNKLEVLRQLGQEMIREARTELERAARSGVLPVQWVQDMMSEAGWNHYWQIRKGQQK